MQRLLITLALTLFVSAASALTIADFVKRPDYEQIRLSPKGDYLAAVIPYEDQNAVVIIDREKMAVTGSMRLTEGQHIGQLIWANDERIVAEILVPQSDNDQLANAGELFAMNADGGKKKLIFGYSAGDKQVGSKIKKAENQYAWAEIMHPLPDDEDFILIASYPYSGSGESTPSVYRLNVYKGTQRLVSRTPMLGGDIAVDSDQERFVSIAETLDGMTRVMARLGDDLDWQELFTTTSLDHIYHAVGFDARGRILALSNRALPTISLTAYDPETGTEEVLLKHERYDMSGVVRGSDGFEVIGSCYEGLRPACEYLDLENPDSALRAGLSKAFPDQTVNVINWTTDRELALLWVTADRNPGDYFLMNIPDKKVNFLLSSRQWIDPNALAPVEAIQFPANDGESISGYLTQPLGMEGPHPAIVMVHGGPHGPRDQWLYDPDVQFLAGEGYAVLQINYRGSGGYGLDFRRAGYRKWGTRIQQDITDGVRWAIDEGLIDENRICIYGGSFGGYSAIMSAALEPDLYQCAIGHVGVYDMEMMFEKGDIPDQRGGPEYLGLVLSTDGELHKQQSPVYHVDKIKADLLISYGLRDDRAPPAQSRRLIDELEAAGKSFKIREERREGHGFVDVNTRASFYKEILAFFDANLGAGESSDTAAISATSD